MSENIQALCESNEVELAPERVFEQQSFVFGGKNESIRGKEGTVRFLTPADAGLLAQLHGWLSEDTVTRRFNGVLPLKTRTDPKRLLERCSCLGGEFPLGVFLDGETLVGVGRGCFCTPGTMDGIAVLVADQHPQWGSFQGSGVGKKLLSDLIEYGTTYGVTRFVSEVAASNAKMKGLFSRFGFKTSVMDTDDPSWLQAELIIDPKADHSTPNSARAVGDILE
jgi:hypothetical protein